jgi:hypothetical protein
MLIFLIIYLFYKNRTKISKLVNIYKQIRDTLDPERKYGHFFIFSSIFKMLFSIVKSRFNHSNQKPFEKFNRNHLKIPYTYNEKQYYYLLKIPRGVQPLKSITDENNTDIQEFITPYLGPNLDCHGIKLSPKDFGYKNIKITTIFDTEVHFEENSDICL